MAFTRRIGIFFAMRDQKSQSIDVYFRFTIAASLGGRRFQSVVCTNKKDGRREAADVALRTLMAEGQYKVAQGLNQVSKKLLS